MTHSPNLFALKLLVISLGVVLLGGMIFMITSLVHAANTEMAVQQCSDVAVHINGQGTLTGVIPQGKLIQLTYTSGEQAKVLTVDRCTGTLLQTLTVMP